jgi:signal peptidase I
MLLRPFLFFCCFSMVVFAHAQDTIKTVPSKVLSFCEKNMGKKVGKGECWDLAKEALDFASAEWTPPYLFGKKLTKKELVKAGDIIQFENVKIIYPDKSWKELPHHTAIIYKVISPGKYIIAEQNANNKKMVILSEIDLNYLKKGQFTVFRPQ